MHRSFHYRHRRFTALVFIVSNMLSTFSAAATPLLELNIGIHRIRAETASTPGERAQGLMHRTELPPQQGMLFVFPVSAIHCFWMRNTLIPLSIAFIDAQGKIINIAEMMPQSERNHCPTRPARYALEMNSGWFHHKGVTHGAYLNGIQQAPPAW